MRVWLLGAEPGEKVDFARFNFHVPTTGSAANAALVPIARIAPTNRVLTMVCMCPPRKLYIDGPLSEVRFVVACPSMRFSCGEHKSLRPLVRSRLFAACGCRFQWCARPQTAPTMPAPPAPE